MQRSLAFAGIALLIVAAAVPGGVAAASGEGSTYTGAVVSFDVQSNAVADYAVDGQTVFDNVSVQSQSKAESSGSVSGDVSLKALVDLQGSGLSLSSQTKASAQVDVEGSASMTAHDDAHGILVVSSGSDSQYVVANLSSESSASAEGDSRVTVESGDGVEGTFIVVGDGSVTVNDDGDVSAKLASDSKLVFRAYPDGRSDQDSSQEQLIADGKAAGEVYAMQRDGEVVTDTVTYGQQMTLSAEQSSEDTVKVTADRAASEGKVVITSVSKEAVGTVSDLSVEVSGGAAAEVSSYSELKSAIGGDESKYMVRQQSSGSAKAHADVLVAFNHFSTRTATISGNDSGSSGGDTTGGDGGSGSSGSSPGFGVGAAVVALAAAAIALRDR